MVTMTLICEQMELDGRIASLHPIGEAEQS